MKFYHWDVPEEYRVLQAEKSMCTNEGKDESSVAREARRGLTGEALRQSGGAFTGGPDANSARGAEQGGIGAAIGPKCIVAGCSNRFGEGMFFGELCAPCHGMLRSGNIHPTGQTFIHSLQRALHRATENSYVARAEALVDARVREWRGAGSELRGAVVGLVVNALKEGEKNAEEGKRQSR